MRDDRTPTPSLLNRIVRPLRCGPGWWVGKVRGAGNPALSILWLFGGLCLFCFALSLLLSPFLPDPTPGTAQAPGSPTSELRLAEQPSVTPGAPLASSIDAPPATPTISLEPSAAPRTESGPIATATSALPPSPALSPRMDYPLPPAGLTEARVVQVVDGDTIDVLVNGEEVRLRLIGLDTPETVDPRSPVQCFGQEASRQAAAMLSGQTVLLEADPSQGEWDAYDRLLRYVWLEDGRLFNLEMIAGGYAHEYTYDLPYRYQDLFRAAQAQAREEALGLWSPQTCAGDTTQPAPAEATPPGAAPATTSNVVISAVDRRAEYVDLTNQGTEAVPLEGWYLLSERGNQGCGLYGVLEPGQTVRVYALAEDRGLGGINCGYDSPIWNNSDSDPAVLFDASGAEVDRR